MKDSKETYAIYRNVVIDPLDIIMKEQDALMLPIILEKDTSSIEEFVGQIKVDFANQFIGGGCLRNGCVQE